MIYNIIKRSIINTWPTLVILIVCLTVIRIAYHRHHHTKFDFFREFFELLSIIYLILLYNLLTNAELNSVSGFNYVPFAEIMRYELGSEAFYFNVIGNIVLFIPFGYLVAHNVRPKRVWTNILIGLIASSTIEIVQYNIGRSFDVDDIILNTIGCIIGYILYKLFKKLLNHLPNFCKRDWFKNLICIIIIAIIIFYILKIWGVIVI